MEEEAVAVGIGGSRGVAAAPSWAKKFLIDFLFSKRLHVFGIFLYVFYNFLILSTLNQY